LPRNKKKNNKNRITRALGQNMLVDREFLAKIVSAAQISNQETVLEAGTGQGIVTAELCKAANHVISYEIDSKLYREAQEQFFMLQFKNLELVHADLFKTKGLQYFDVFVSNLPYSRSRDAFEWLSTQKFDRAIVMVQEEFAEKLSARPGSKTYRAISVLAHHCFAIEKLFKVRKQSFEPQPGVESAIIKIIPINTITKETIKNIHILFSKRNKKAASVAAKLGIDNVDYGTKKIDELEPKDLVKIAESISNVSPI
jgi:16S rRNA (adenine1518-N6/adenine1519-N6)-dimethyltransferase